MNEKEEEEMSDILDGVGWSEDDGEDDRKGSDLSGQTLDVVNQDGTIDPSVMSREDAERITTAIESAATATYALLVSAHEGKAYIALGYPTWESYVHDRFSMSTQRSYQLLDLGKVTSALEEVVPAGTQVRLTEAQARDIKRELPLITEKVKERTEGADPDTAAAEVDALIAEAREQQKADRAVIAAKAKDTEEQRAQQRSDALEAQADDLLSDAAPEPVVHAPAPNGGSLPLPPGDDDTEGAAPMGSGAAVELYTLVTSLEGLAGAGDGGDVAARVPKSRRDQVLSSARKASQFLSDFIAELDR